MSYTHIRLSERICIQNLLSQGLKTPEIAEILGRYKSTIYREINRNKPIYKSHRKSNNRYNYNVWRAQNLYMMRRRKSVRAALKPSTPEWDFIIESLQQYWSPEIIRERWNLLHPGRNPICVSTLYRYIKSKKFPLITAKKNLRRRGKRMLPKDSSYNSIQPDRIIPQWSDVIKGRLRIGDWEGDTVYSGVGKGFLVTLVDRRSRYLRMGLPMNRTAEETRKVIEKLLDGFPVHSISLDNGSEFSEFHKFEENLNTLVYFAEPHKPWQRGTNENTNDIVRFFFPKDTDFRKVLPEDVQHVEDFINNLPKKCLESTHSKAQMHFTMGTLLW